MSLNDRDPEKAKAWRERSVRRYQDKRRANPGKGLNRTGAKAKRERPALDAFREAVHARVWCELDTPACPSGRHLGHHAHHIAPSDRDRGVHDPARGLLVCAAGHSWVHNNTGESYARGWLMRSAA